MSGLIPVGSSPEWELNEFEAGDEEEWKDGSIAIHEHVSGSSYHEIPEAGHAVAIEQPQAIVAVIKKFLASLS